MYREREGGRDRERERENMDVNVEFLGRNELGLAILRYTMSMYEDGIMRPTKNLKLEKGRTG
jgi:hypothetical protein